MNLKHLYYFWKVAKHGGIVRASDAISITPQTLSGQIRLLERSLGTSLFLREGRGLELSEAGRLALNYADEIFALDAELEQALRDSTHCRATLFRVGVSDAMPKSLAYRLLQPALDMAMPVRIVCREWRVDRLLSELALHRLDMVLSDTPVPNTIDIRAHSHRLATSGVAFVVPRELAGRTAKPFPGCLEDMPLLLPGEDSAMRRNVDEWMERQRLHTKIAGEFDDSALMATFGKAGKGAFPIPAVLIDEICADGSLTLLGQIKKMRVDYFGIYIPRRLNHPCLQAVISAADPASGEPRRE